MAQIISRKFRLCLLALVVFPCWLRAHTPSQTYLSVFLTDTNVAGHWDIALRDLQQGLGLDSNSVMAISAEDLERRQEAFALDTIARLDLKLDDHALFLRVTDYFQIALNQGDYLRVQFTGDMPPAAPVTASLNARVLFNLDTNVHGLFRLEHRGRTETVAFDRNHPAHIFTLSEPSSRWGQFATFVREGVWHIWIGIDHLLFLVALLLPSVLHREGERWTGVPAFRPAFITVLKIVTAFTIAHSITLSLAALNIVRLPSRLVESVIAASVAVAALNNLYPWMRGRAWMVAFGFGLVHGFGFASVLGELGLKSGTLAMALVGFNLGVELGQLSVVAVFLPLAFVLRRTWFYQTATFKFGSVLIILVATAWMTERMFALKVLPF